MGLEINGHQASVIRLVLDTTGAEYPVPGRAKLGVYGGRTARIRLRNMGADVVRVYFDKQDFENDTDNYLTLIGDEILAENIQIDRIWLKAEANTPTIEFMVMYARG